MQIDLKLKEIKKYIIDEYPYYGKENVVYDNGIENDETQYIEIKSISNNLEEDNNNNNENNNINEENGEQEKYIENGNNLKQNQNNYSYNAKQSSKSYEILMRHLAKKKMIKENMEIAEENIRNQDLVLNNRNVVI